MNKKTTIAQGIRDMITKHDHGGRRPGAGRPTRDEPKTPPVWIGQISERDREFILSELTPDERFAALFAAAQEKRNNKKERVEFSFNAENEFEADAKIDGVLRDHPADRFIMLKEGPEHFRVILNPTPADMKRKNIVDYENQNTDDRLG